MPHESLQVGVPDPELDTSPIVGDVGDAAEFETQVRRRGCRFNGLAYRPGDVVLSGRELLRCEASGYWVSEGDLW